MKTLIVVSQVFIKEDGTETVSRAFNYRMNEYSKHFDKINVIGPGKKDFKFIQGNNKKIFYTSTTLYDRPIKKRIIYYFNFFKAFNFFREIFSEIKPDFVEIRIPSLFTMIAYYSAKRLNIPTTCYIAGDWYESFVSNYKFCCNKIVAYLLELSQTAIIKNSIAVAAGKELVNKYSNLNNNIHEYISTTHTESFYIEKNNKILNLIFVGRLEKLKKVDIALKSVKILVDKKIPLIFNIVGDGKEKNKLKQLAYKLGIEDKVIFHGYVSEKEILEKLYKEAHIMIFPSVSEGSPKVILEAMAYSVIPIAIKTTGSIRYIINDGINGFLVNKNSYQEIALKVEKLIQNKEKEKEMRKNCYLYAKEHTMEKEIDNMFKFIKKQIKDIK